MKTSYKRLILILILIIIISVIAVRYIKNSEKKEIFFLKENDKKVSDAKQAAQLELPFLIQYLNNSNYSCLIKIPFKEGDKTEHMWIYVTDYSNGKFGGLLANNPVYIKKYSFGDIIIIEKEEVEDWAIQDNEGNTFKGNFLEQILNS